MHTKRDTSHNAVNYQLLTIPRIGHEQRYRHRSSHGPIVREHIVVGYCCRSGGTLAGLVEFHGGRTKWAGGILSAVIRRMNR